MGFLKEIEGCKAENLTSAVLRYLLINCDRFRKSFAELITEKVQDYREKVSFDNGVMCRTEKYVDNEADEEDDSGEKGAVTNTNGKNSSGRVDLCVESDEHIIFIENKLWAGFQENQPEKYFRELSEKTAQRDKVPFMVVLCPKTREDKIKRKLEKIKEAHKNDPDWKIILGHIIWQDIRNSLEGILKNLPQSELRSIIIMFIEYLNGILYEKIHFHDGKDWEKYMSSIIQEGKGNYFQESLVKKIRYLLSTDEEIRVGKFARAKKGWFGFYFYFKKNGTSNKTVWNWFGFANRPMKDSAKNAELLIQQEKQEFKYNEDRNFIKESGHTDNSYIIKFDKSWDTLCVWSERLDGILKAMKKAAFKARADEGS